MNYASVLRFIRRMVILFYAVTVTTAAHGQLANECQLTSETPFETSFDARDKLHPVPHSENSPHVAFHGQGVYGTNTVYFSHLGVFMRDPANHPHAFQVLLEVEFELDSAREKFILERAAHGDAFYTAVPPRFDITALALDASGSARLGRLPDTTLFRGHFEQMGNVKILDKTPMRIARVVHFREFAPDAIPAEFPQYLLFGQGNDTFVASMLLAPPAWDHISSVEVALVEPIGSDQKTAFEEALAEGLYLLLPGRAYEVEARLRTDETLECDWIRDNGQSPLTIKLRLVEELYCEQGELSMPVINKFNSPKSCAS